MVERKEVLQQLIKMYFLVFTRKQNAEYSTWYIETEFEYSLPQAWDKDIKRSMEKCRQYT